MKKYVISVFIIVFNSFLYSQNVVYVPKITDSDINANINTGKNVGNISSQFEVTNRGGFMYSIPIQIPLGTNGMNPEVSIIYNSQSSSGLLGQGWHLNAGSFISRANKSIYYNASVEAVDLDNDDQIFLDGEALIHSNGIFYKEQEDFSRITLMGGSLSSSSAWFKVETKEGLILEYGRITNSKLLSSDGLRIMEWHLNKITDLNGNYITYSYKILNNQHYLDEIWYTGNIYAGTAPYNKIKFEYNERVDENCSFNKGNPIYNKLLLINIKTYSDGIYTKQYNFSYSNDGVHSFLAKVEEKGCDGTLLNPTIIKYGNNNNTLDYKTATNITNGTNKKFRTGDFNGDGLTDVISVDRSNYDPSIGGFYDVGYSLYIKNANRNYYSNFTTGANSTFTGNEYQWVDGQKMPSYKNYLTTDYNGDEKDDLLLLKTSWQGSNLVLSQANLLTFNNNGTSASTNTRSFPSPKRIHSSGKYFLPGDFNGDGVNDFLTILSANGSDYQLYFNSFFTNEFEETIQLNGQTYSGTSLVNADNLYTLDFNGDGKTDIMKIEGLYCTIYEINQTSIYTYALKEIYFAGYPTKWHDILFGDFNGDGKTDLLTTSNCQNCSNSLTWNIAYSTGINFIETNTGITHGQMPNANKIPNASYYSLTDKVIVSDYNGDGLSDISYAYTNTSSQNEEFNIWYSKGFNTSTPFNYQHYSMATNGVINTMLSGDFNGDSKSEIMNVMSITSDIGFFRFNADSKDLLVEKIRDAYGNILEMNYKPLTDGTYVYEKLMQGPTQFPINFISNPIYVSYQLKQSNGIGGYNTTTYKYRTAVIHKQGKGFLGFKGVESFNNADNTTIFDEYVINMQFYKLYLAATNLKRNGVNINYMQQNQTFIGLGGNRFWMRKDLQQKIDYQTSATTIESFSYDNYGNILSFINDINGVVRKQIDYSFIQKGTWIPSHVASSNENSKRLLNSHGNDFNKITNFSYNNRGQLVNKIDFAGQAKALTSSFTYDNFGNIIQTNFSSPGLTTKNTVHTYDSKGRFLIQTVNELGQTTNYNMDTKWGKPSYIIGIDGLTTSYTYDGFGRLQTTLTPQGNTIYNMLFWASTGSNKVYGTYKFNPGNPYEKTFYDSKERSVQKESQIFGGSLVYIDYKYDNIGNLTEETEPYTTIPQIVHKTFYNIDNKVNQKATLVNGSASHSVNYTYTYGGGNIAINANSSTGKNESKTIDASGQIIESSDNGGTLNFYFDGKGNITKTTMGGVQISEISYDSYGRKTELNDINAGTTSYEFNGFDELIYIKEPRGGVTTYTYDVLGRKIVENLPEGAINYTYETAANGINNIKNVTGYNNINKDFEYDMFGRITQVTESIKGKNYNTKYYYDNENHMIKTEYSSGFTANYEYDYMGNLSIIKNGNGNILFETNTKDAYGRNIEYTYGNGIRNLWVYDNANLPSQIKSYSTGNTVMDIQYSFDSNTGNLTERFDALTNISEIFTYDVLDRLVESKVQGLQAIQLVYASNGNINNKTDAGTYTYDNTKINAAIRVSNDQANISELRQDIEYTSFHQPYKIMEGPEVCKDYVPVISDPSTGEGGNLKSGTLSTASKQICKRLYDYTLEYGYEQQRKELVYYYDAVYQYTRHYVGDMEVNYKSGAQPQYVHYLSGGNGINIIIITQGTTTNNYYAHTDYLGSILKVTDQSKNVVADQNFDAWGSDRNPNDLSYNTTNLATIPNWLYRGYTGHEHYRPVALVNMNGRMYDPILGRMLSPDNYIQDPFNTQNHNRYSYVVNNPLKYTDPDGELILLAIIIGVVTNTVIQAKHGNINNFGDFATAAFTGAVSGGLFALNPGLFTTLAVTSATANLVRGDWQGMANAAKIFAGNFYTDGNRNFFGQTWQAISRYTWELPTNTVGYGYSQLRNIFNRVERVDYYGGVTFSTNYATQGRGRGGVSFGSYVNANRNANNRNLGFDIETGTLYGHEFGHTFDSRIFGPLYLFVIGIPSAIESVISDSPNFYTERRADLFWEKYRN